MECLRITEEELKSIENYTGMAHKQLNSLLSTTLTNEYSYLLDKSFYFPIYENEENLKKDINQIFNIYGAMVKNSYVSDVTKYNLYRGTNTDNIKQQSIGFISTTTSKDMAENYFTSSFKNNKAIINIKNNSNIPHYIMMNDINYGNNFEKEVILSPFVNLNYNLIKKNSEKSYYQLELTKINLENIIDYIEFEEISCLLKPATDALKECINIKKIISELFDKSYTLELMICKVSFDEKKEIYSVLDEINEELSRLNKLLKEKENLYLNFKLKTQLYIKQECDKIEKNIELSFNKEKEDNNSSIRKK